MSYKRVVSERRFEGTAKALERLAAYRVERLRYLVYVIRTLKAILRDNPYIGRDSFRLAVMMSKHVGLSTDDIARAASVSYSRAYCWRQRATAPAEPRHRREVIQELTLAVSGILEEDYRDEQIKEAMRGSG